MAVDGPARPFARLWLVGRVFSRPALPAAVVAVLAALAGLVWLLAEGPVEVVLEALGSLLLEAGHDLLAGLVAGYHLGD